MDYIDIVIFAMIAAFLVYRLRSVLGRRTGNERERPNPFATRPQPVEVPDDKVVPLPDRSRPDSISETLSAEPPDLQPAGGLEQGLRQIRSLDASFSDRGFLKGAEMAFGMIVEAFAKGDTATLRPLLSDQLYDEFSSAIRQRLAEGQTSENKLERIVSSELIDARVDGRTALVTVKFVSQQSARDGDDGEPGAQPVTDIWTFARNTRATDPNWTLVETATPA